jgi:hypothetical protein
MLQNFNLQNILNAIECGGIDTGKGLNQDIGLARPGQTMGLSLQNCSKHYQFVSSHS